MASKIESFTFFWVELENVKVTPVKQCVDVILHKRIGRNAENFEIVGEKVKRTVLHIIGNIVNKQ